LDNLVAEKLSVTSFLSGMEKKNKTIMVLLANPNKNWLFFANIKV